MEFLILAVLIGLIPAAIAKSKGRNFLGWWIYGAAIFIIALPHALIIKTNQEAIDNEKLSEGMKKCPYCAEMIKKEAKVCRYCSRELINVTEDYNFKGITKDEAINIWKANPGDKRTWGEVVALWEEANKSNG